MFLWRQSLDVGLEDATNGRSKKAWQKPPKHMADGITHIKWTARPVLALKALAFLIYICCRHVARQSWRMTVKVLQIWLVWIESGSHVPSLPSNDHHVHCSRLISSVDKAIYGIWTGRWRTRWTQALGRGMEKGTVLDWKQIAMLLSELPPTRKWICDMYFWIYYIP